MQKYENLKIWKEKSNWSGMQKGCHKLKVAEPYSQRGAAVIAGQKLQTVTNENSPASYRANKKYWAVGNKRLY